jgi:hypothetical protein
MFTSRPLAPSLLVVGFALCVTSCGGSDGSVNKPCSGGGDTIMSSSPGDSCCPGLSGCTLGAGIYTCRDLRTDRYACGKCGVWCGHGECVAGACQCPSAPVTSCPLHDMAGTVDVCVDTATDPRHCGGCDIACTGGTACVAGACN